MRMHEFTPEDLYTGAELVCIQSNDYSYVVGGIYEVEGYYYNRMWICSEGFSRQWSIRNMNDPVSEVKFYPYNLLPEKDKFVLSLSGRLPE